MTVAPPRATPARRVNPIWLKSARARLRPRHLLSWGLVTITVTLFVAIMIYSTMTERRLATVQDAAKAVLPAIVVIQAVILMMFGTGAVAAGVSQERDEGLLDYHRMTPMRPTAKILGYLFGLPVREYVLFAMTLPLVAVAVLISGFNLLTLAHFYVVFFTSVWVYHMTGLVAGMIAPKPRLASMLSIGMVVVLYFVLPNLSRVGITLFEFLTIRPTFFGLLQQELPAHMRPAAEASGIDSFRDVPLFAGLVHPTVYSLLVQGFLLATMFSIAHRKWRNQALHIFSKLGAFLVFAGVVVLLLGSIWAVIVQEDAYRRVFARFDQAARLSHRAPETLQLLFTLFACIVGVAYLFLIATVTSSRHTAIEGWRRARKLGRARLSPNSDAASSLPLALAMLALALGAGILLLLRVDELGEYFRSGPTLHSIVVFATGVVGASLFTQGLRETLGLRAFAVILFVVWMIPFFAMMIMYSAFEAWTAGAYVGLPCPPVLMVYSIAEMLRSAPPLPGVSAEFLPSEIVKIAPTVTALGAAAYAVAGVVAQAARARARARIRALGCAGADDASPAQTTAPAQTSPAAQPNPA